MHSCDYDSSFEDDSPRKRETINSFNRSKPSFHGESSNKTNQTAKRKYECGMDEYRKYFSSFNAFDRHKILINQYLLYHIGSTSLLTRDTSKDKTDFDVIKENHQFLWEDNSSIETWGKKIAKKYYDKLFKEYCICDLSRYKEGNVGMRWRIQKEVVEGKGQFICGEKRCHEKDNLRTWEMNFGYVEHGEKKNALVKLRLCHDCSYRLNYKSRKKEIKKKSKPQKFKDDKKRSKKEKHESEEEREEEEASKEVPEKVEEQNVWKEPPKVFEEKEKEEEFEEYLQDLFL